MEVLGPKLTKALRDPRNNEVINWLMSHPVLPSVTIIIKEDYLLEIK